MNSLPSVPLYWSTKWPILLHHWGSSYFIWSIVGTIFFFYKWIALKKKQRENIMLWQQNLYFVCNIITGVSGTKNIFIYWRQHKHLITYLIQLMNLKCIVYNINYHLDFLKKKKKKLKYWIICLLVGDQSLTRKTFFNLNTENWRNIHFRINFFF